ncbi:Golgin sub A member 2 [Borealophlyctis nickersoniae]|nr:Golgin sub A member 2 [Borealophlyctis nickersoniae]
MLLLDDDDDANATETLGISKELLEKEKEYLRMNKEIQSKTAKVVKKVEAVVKEGKQAVDRPISPPGASKAAEDSKGPIKATSRPQTAVSGRGKTTVRRAGDIGEMVRPNSNTKRPVATGSRSTKPSSFADTHHTLVGGGKSEGGESASETAHRLLQAKLQVLQEEFGQVVAERDAKDTAIALLEEKLKIMDDEKSKLTKSFNALQSSLTTQQQNHQTLQTTHTSTLATLAAVQKQLDTLTRAHRTLENECNAKDVRLNRVVEEVDRCKAALSKSEADAKEKLEVSKRTQDRLLADIKRLQRQKTELLAAFRKQGQLVGVIKRQKMHIEAAKLLQFTEEEFLRALNWDL